jgi:hypothetical protein
MFCLARDDGGVSPSIARAIMPGIVRGLADFIERVFENASICA